ncbi:hypothetical protein HYW44_04000 [Candidatus Daviesbacteria bacterium]|nr:hypothetical protein [Candidatus Daviesbacteria bacterium]
MTPKQFKEILKEELQPIIEVLGEHSKVLGEHSKLLGTHGQKIDALVAEMHEVHKLADTTVDIVKARYEKNKREIDEIKDHLGLPKEPFFAE